MPTYDYQCRSCGQTIEVIHGMLDEGPGACERCGGSMRRILHPAGIIFKGSGFYKTDSRSGTSSSPGTAKPASGTDASTKPATGGGEAPSSSAKESTSPSGGPSASRSAGSD